MVKIIRFGNIWMIQPDQKIQQLVKQYQKDTNRSKVVLNLPDKALRIE